MTSFKSINRRAAAVFAMSALLLATLLPGIVPAFASAAQVTERSVELSSSSKAATGVTYTVGYTSVAAAKAFVLDFCSDTPLIGVACGTPAGFSVAGASVDADSSVAFTKSALGTPRNNAAVFTGAIGAGDTVSLVLTGVTNPSAAGPLYVRIVTYTGADATEATTNAQAYASAATPGTGSVDQGGAAVSITDTIGVSGAVLESMTFCVTAQALQQDNCADAASRGVPTLKLGKTTGDITALTPSEVSEGNIYSQISTNAASGAVVNLKSSTTGCGGLVRAGTTGTCEISPALSAGISAGQAKFGVKVGTASAPVSGQAANSTGSFQAATGSIYDTSVFKLHYVNLDASGVTGPFGDPFLDTDGAPVSNKNMQLTFGASISNSTPAGLYSTDLSLIATGKF